MNVCPPLAEVQSSSVQSRWWIVLPEDWTDKCSGVWLSHCSWSLLGLRPERSKRSHFQFPAPVTPAFSRQFLLSSLGVCVCVHQTIHHLLTATYRFTIYGILHTIHCLVFCSFKWYVKKPAIFHDKWSKRTCCIWVVFIIWEIKTVVFLLCFAYDAIGSDCLIEDGEMQLL